VLPRSTSIAPTSRFFSQRFGRLPAPVGGGGGPTRSSTNPDVDVHRDRSYEKNVRRDRSYEKDVHRDRSYEKDVRRDRSYEKDVHRDRLYEKDIHRDRSYEKNVRCDRSYEEDTHHDRLRAKDVRYDHPRDPELHRDRRDDSENHRHPFSTEKSHHRDDAHHGREQVHRERDRYRDSRLSDNRDASSPSSSLGKGTGGEPQREDLAEQRSAMEEKIFESLCKGSLAPIAHAFSKNPTLQAALKLWEGKQQRAAVKGASLRLDKSAKPAPERACSDHSIGVNRESYRNLNRSEQPSTGSSQSRGDHNPVRVSDERDLRRDGAFRHGYGNVPTSEQGERNAHAGEVDQMPAGSAPPHHYTTDIQRSCDVDHVKRDASDDVPAPRNLRARKRHSAVGDDVEFDVAEDVEEGFKGAHGDLTWARKRSSVVKKGEPLSAVKFEVATVKKPKLLKPPAALFRRRPKTTRKETSGQQGDEFEDHEPPSEAPTDTSTHGEAPLLHAPDVGRHEMKFPLLGNPDVGYDRAKKPLFHDPDVGRDKMNFSLHDNPGVGYDRAKKTFFHALDVDRDKMNFPLHGNPDVGRDRTKKPFFHDPDIGRDKMNFSLHDNPDVGYDRAKKPFFYAPDVDREKMNFSLHDNPDVGYDRAKKPFFHAPDVDRDKMNFPLHDNPDVGRDRAKKPFFHDPDIGRDKMNFPLHDNPDVGRDSAKKPLLRAPVVRRDKMNFPLHDNPDVGRDRAKKPLLHAPDVGRDKMKYLLLEKPDVGRDRAQIPLRRDPDVDRDYDNAAEAGGNSTQDSNSGHSEYVTYRNARTHPPHGWMPPAKRGRNERALADDGFQDDDNDEEGSNVFDVPRSPTPMLRAPRFRPRRAIRARPGPRQALLLCMRPRPRGAAMAPHPHIVTSRSYHPRGARHVTTRGLPPPVNPRTHTRPPRPILPAALSRMASGHKQGPAVRGLLLRRGVRRPFLQRPR